MTLKEFYDEVRTWETINGWYRTKDSRPYREHIHNCMNLGLMEFGFHGNIAVCKILKPYHENYEKATTVVRGYIKVKRIDRIQETIDKAIELFKSGYSKKDIGNMLNITHVFLTKILEDNFTPEERKKHKVEQCIKNSNNKKGGKEMTDKEKLVDRYGEEKINEVIRRFNGGEARHFMYKLLHISKSTGNNMIHVLFTPEEIQTNKDMIMEKRGKAVSLGRQKSREAKAKMADINKHDVEIEVKKDKCMDCQVILKGKDETILELKELNDKLSATIEDVKTDNTPENIKKFKDITTRMTELYALKNKKYGNSFSKTFKEYGKPVVCLRIDDKMSRLKQMILRGESDTADESILDTLIDIANYSVMSIVELENANQE